MPSERWLAVRVSERSFNWAIGLSVCSWAVLGMTATDEGALGSPVRWGIALLNLLVGVLFLVRQPAKAIGGMRDVLQALPALVVAGLGLRLAPHSAGWPIAVQAVFLAGVVLTIWSFLRLGRCFAVLPAWRGVVTAGPYRWVRHPAYSGELLMLRGCALASGFWGGYAVLAAAVVLVCVRAKAEERVLDRDPDYRAYRQKTPDLLVPGLSALTCLLARMTGGTKEPSRPTY